MNTASRKDACFLLTPPGAAAIAVVRLVGPSTRAFLAKHFSASTPLNRCVHGALRDEPGVVLDDPVVVVSDDGNVADINVHGGAWVVQSTLNLATAAGFELSDSAPVDANEDDLTREMLEHLPFARTELALRILLAQPHAWAKILMNPKRDELTAMLADRSLHHLLNPPTVAIVGVPNVGKSTLANQLFAQERSITADMPGTTRDWVGEIANIDGLAVRLVDTPGVRETPDAIERTAIERSGEQVRRADVVLLVLDVSMPIAPHQSQLIDAHPDAMKIINKVDCPAAWDAAAVADGLPIAATTGLGITELRDAIKRHFDCLNRLNDQPRIWTQRQRGLVERLVKTG